MEMVMPMLAKQTESIIKYTLKSILAIHYVVLNVEEDL